MVKSISLTPNTLQFNIGPYSNEQEIIIKNTGTELITFSNQSSDIVGLELSELTTLQPSVINTPTVVESSPEGGRNKPGIKMWDNNTKGVIFYNDWTNSNDGYYRFFTKSGSTISLQTAYLLTGVKNPLIIPIDDNYACVCYTNSSDEIVAYVYEINSYQLQNPGSPTVLTVNGYYAIPTQLRGFLVDSDRIIIAHEHNDSGIKIIIRTLDIDTATKTVTANTTTTIVSDLGDGGDPEISMLNDTKGAIIFGTSSQSACCLFEISGNNVNIGNVIRHVNFTNKYSVAFINESKYIAMWKQIGGLEPTQYQVYSISNLNSTSLISNTDISGNPDSSSVFDLITTGENLLSTSARENFRTYDFDSDSNLISEKTNEPLNYSFSAIVRPGFWQIEQNTKNLILIGQTSIDGVELTVIEEAESDVLNVSFKAYKKSPQIGTITIESDATSSPDEIPVTISMSIKEIDEYDYITPCPVRWDWLSYNFYGSFNYVEQLIEANKHIPYYWRKAVFLPTGTNLIIPTIEEIQLIIDSEKTDSETIENFPDFVG